ncbi:MAG: hypothetical protein MOGMAGMI_01126 [Candidatus Omnitrophica bacterium]|nr:hypothetical protein [Candidatus Omnitrophota bacterium]
MIPGQSFFWRVYTKEGISEEVGWFLLFASAVLMHSGLARSMSERQWGGTTSFLMASAVALMGAASQKAYSVRFCLLAYLTGLCAYGWFVHRGALVSGALFFSFYYLYKMFKYRNTFEVHV